MCTSATRCCWGCCSLASAARRSHPPAVEPPVTLSSRPTTKRRRSARSSRTACSSTTRPTGSRCSWCRTPPTTAPTTSCANSPADGVRLLRMAERGGKTVGLNAAVARGDAARSSCSRTPTRMYRATRCARCVRNFADPDGGRRRGRIDLRSMPRRRPRPARPSTGSTRLPSSGSRARLGSVVGGDGAIYAIRRRLYRDDARRRAVRLRQSAADRRAGLPRASTSPRRSPYEARRGDFDASSAARCASSTAPGVPRGHAAAAEPVPHMASSPSKLISHKLLRWLVPVFLAVLLVLEPCAAAAGAVYAASLAAQLAFYALALAGACHAASRAHAAAPERAVLLLAW